MAFSCRRSSSRSRRARCSSRCRGSSRRSAGEIGLAKALGYTDGQVLAHYLLFSLVIAVGGSLLGIVLGDWIARAIVAAVRSTARRAVHGPPRLPRGRRRRGRDQSTVACVLAGLAPAWKSARMARRRRRCTPTRTWRCAAAACRSSSGCFGWALPRDVHVPHPAAQRVPREAPQRLHDPRHRVRARPHRRDRVVVRHHRRLIDKVFERPERWDVHGRLRRAVRRGAAHRGAPLGGRRARSRPRFMLPAELHSAGEVTRGVLTAMEPGRDFHGFEITEGAPPARRWRRADSSLGAAVADKLGVGVGDRVERQDAVPRRADRRSGSAPSATRRSARPCSRAWPGEGARSAAAETRTTRCT